MKNKTGVYIHVPYCVRKCVYCDFYSITDRSSEKDYVDALCRHFELRSKENADRTVDTVFFGGGTPSLLSPESFKTIMSALRCFYDIRNDAEITVEANPATLSEDKLSAFISCGVNRISVGFQSAIDSELKLLARIHGKQDFFDTYRLIRDSGLKNVNIDLMYGIPEQTLSSLSDSLAAVAMLKPEHVSVYGLKIEPESYLGKHTEEFSLPDDELQCEMYKYISNTLSEYGYVRYEFSNFAKPGFECRHNLKYWQREEYLGFGPAASSFVGKTRYTYTRDLRAYIDRINRGIEPDQSEYCEITGRDVENERIMLGLRLSQGIAADDLLLSKSRKFIDGGFMSVKGNRLCLTDEGILVSNYILSELIN